MSPNIPPSDEVEGFEQAQFDRARSARWRTEFAELDGKLTAVITGDYTPPVDPDDPDVAQHLPTAHAQLVAYAVLAATESLLSELRRFTSAPER